MNPYTHISKEPAGGSEAVDTQERLGSLVAEAWDDGNAAGLDGYVGPGRGAGDVDPEAVQRRDRILAKIVHLSSTAPAEPAPTSVNGGSEAYCVDSGKPVRWEAGDRCKSHGDRSTPCHAALRSPRCTHPDWPEKVNGSDKCPECGEIAVRQPKPTRDEIAAAIHDSERLHKWGGSWTGGVCTESCQQAFRMRAEPIVRLLAQETK